MYPVKTQDANLLYKGPTEDVGDLWVHRIRPGVVRVTYEPSPSELHLLREGGRVQLTIMHEPLAPILMEVKAEDVTRPVDDHPFKVNKEPKTSPPPPAAVIPIEEARHHGQRTNEPTTPESEASAPRQVPALGPTPEAFPPRASEDDVPAPGGGERGGGSSGDPADGSR